MGRRTMAAGVAGLISAGVLILAAGTASAAGQTWTYSGMSHGTYLYTNAAGHHLYTDTYRGCRFTEPV